MTKDEVFHKNLILNKEFALYILEHPEFAKEIPEGAIVVLMPEDDPELAKANLKMARGMQESEQPMVLVRLRKLKPITSRITRFKMEVAV